MSIDAPATPLAYMITFRTYGTWLHGDARGSIDRRNNVFGAPLIRTNRRWQTYERHVLVQAPVTLDADRRHAVRAAINEICLIRDWRLHALNVRTNHVHTVVSARIHPDQLLIALKANATKTMRSRGCWSSERGPWSAGGSTRYVWTEHGLDCAIVYVRDRQGSPLE